MSLKFNLKVVSYSNNSHFFIGPVITAGLAAHLCSSYDSQLGNLIYTIKNNGFYKFQSSYLLKCWNNENHGRKQVIVVQYRSLVLHHAWLVIKEARLVFASLFFSHVQSYQNSALLLRLAAPRAHLALPQGEHPICSLGWTVQSSVDGVCLQGNI